MSAIPQRNYGLVFTINDGVNAVRYDLNCKDVRALIDQLRGFADALDSTGGDPTEIAKLTLKDEGRRRRKA